MQYYKIDEYTDFAFDAIVVLKDCYNYEEWGMPWNEFLALASAEFTSICQELITKGKVDSWE